MTNDLNNCTNARKWAEEFVRVRRQVRNQFMLPCPIEETVESMECWFASALLAGKADGVREANQHWRNRGTAISLLKGCRVCYTPETGEEVKLTKARSVNDAKWGVNGSPGWVFDFRDGKPTAYSLDLENIEQD